MKITPRTTAHIFFVCALVWFFDAMLAVSFGHRMAALLDGLVAGAYLGVALWFWRGGGPRGGHGSRPRTLQPILAPA